MNNQFMNSILIRLRQIVKQTRGSGFVIRSPVRKSLCGQVIAFPWGCVYFMEPCFRKIINLR